MLPTAHTGALPLSRLHSVPSALGGRVTVHIAYTLLFDNLDSKGRKLKPPDGWSSSLDFC